MEEKAGRGAERTGQDRTGQEVAVHGMLVVPSGNSLTTRGRRGRAGQGKQRKSPVAKRRSISGSRCRRGVLGGGGTEYQESSHGAAWAVVMLGRLSGRAAASNTTPKKR